MPVRSCSHGIPVLPDVDTDCTIPPVIGRYVVL